MKPDDDLLARIDAPAGLVSSYLSRALDALEVARRENDELRTERDALRAVVVKAATNPFDVHSPEWGGYMEWVQHEADLLRFVAF